MKTWLMKKGLALAAVAAALAGFGDGASLPEGYEQMKGIASTSGGNQYVLTDYVPSSCDVRIEATVTLTKYGTQGIWCSRMGTNDRTLTLFCWAAAQYLRMDRNNNTGTYVNLQPPLNTPTTLVADYKALTFSVDGKASANKMGSGSFTPASKLAFFASHTNGGGWGNYAVMTLHGAKVYDADGNLEREYVPARKVADAGKATEYGLYETRQGKYFSVSGAKAFDPVTEVVHGWSEDPDTDSLIITVENGIYELTAEDAARITGTTRANLVKRGSGTAVGTPIQAFAGNILIEEGVFQLSHPYDCGADNEGWIRVCDGASLKVTPPFGGSLARAITGKTIYTTGEGYRGIGAICGGCNWNSCGACQFILEGDSYYAVDAEFNFANYIDLAGHRLTGMQAYTWNRWGINATTITNSAATPALFDFTNGLLRVEGTCAFKGKAADGAVRIRGGKPKGTAVIATSTLTSAWPIEVGPNVLYEARKASDHSNLSQGGLSGTMTFKGNVDLATTVEAGTNSLANLKGTLTGDGSIDVGSGWVNFQTKANDYAGTVSASRSDTLASADLRAGVCVVPGAVYSASATVLTNADFALGAGASEVKSPLRFTGDAQSRLTGGNYTGERTKLGFVGKSGAGELLFSAGVTVTGRVEVTGGTLRIPSREEFMPVVGKPGLMGSVTNVACWYFPSPDKGDIPCVYDTVFPHGNDLTSRWDGNAAPSPRTTMARGYIWNRTGDTASWTFMPHHSSAVWFWLDGECVFSAKTTGNSVETRTVSPGPHEYVLITTSNSGASGPQYIKWVSGLGSLYDALPIDFEGRGSSDGANFSPSLDPGDGSIFTIDATPTDELDDPFWLPEVATAAFGPGTTFDVGGYDYRVDTLEGCPTVIDVGTLTVGKAYALNEAGISAGQPLTVEGDGVLAFAEGCELDLAFDLDDATAATCQALDAGVTVVADTAMRGAPTLSARLAQAGAKLTVSEDGRSLVLRVPGRRYVRQTESGVEVGYAVTPGKPAKEARIDVYRDGALIDQQFVGDGHRRCEGVWNYRGPGYYFVRTTRATEDGEEQTVFGYALVLDGNERFVAPSGDDANDGTSLAAPCASIIKAVASLGDAGGRVYALPGTYAEKNVTNGVTLAAAVQVIGLTDDPGEVVVTRDTSVQSRVFRLDHPDAAIRFLTVTGGEGPATTDYLESNGGNVFVTSKGGTVENCVLLNGSTYAAWSGGGGNIALFGGRMANCRIVGGRNNTNGENQWVQCGGSVCVRGSALVENCLITDCLPADERSGGAPVALYGAATMVNCTVANSSGHLAGGVLVCQWNNALPRVVNCAFYGNTTAADVAANPHKSVYASIATYRSSSGCTDAEAAAAFANCAAAVGLNGSCVTADEPLFIDAANGDYRLQPESPLVNAGTDTAGYGAQSVTDLIGAPRKARAIDIGCFEWRAPRLEAKGLYFLVK